MNLVLSLKLVIRKLTCWRFVHTVRCWHTVQYINKTLALHRIRDCTHLALLFWARTSRLDQDHSTICLLYQDAWDYLKVVNALHNCTWTRIKKLFCSYLFADIACAKSVETMMCMKPECCTALTIWLLIYLLRQTAVLRDDYAQYLNYNR